MLTKNGLGFVLSIKKTLLVTLFYIHESMSALLAAKTSDVNVG
jgi:hypothetical protein